MTSKSNSSQCTKKTVTLTYRGVKYKAPVRPYEPWLEELKVGMTA